MMTICQGDNQDKEKVWKLNDFWPIKSKTPIESEVKRQLSVAAKDGGFVTTIFLLM